MKEWHWPAMLREDRSTFGDQLPTYPHPDPVYEGPVEQNAGAINPVQSDIASQLQIRHVRKHFRDVEAVADVSIDINRGEFFTLLGPSGCGKTTLLRIVAGLEIPDQGEIFLN